MNQNSGNVLESGQALAEVVTAYLKALEAGQVPDPEQWLRRYPELASQLAEFFAGQEQLDRLAAPLRALAPAPPGEPKEPPGAARQATPAPGDTAVSAPQSRERSFGDYELLEEVARGGMGIVYKARQLSLNRIVALKMILTGQLAFPVEVQRFRSEAEAAAYLDHPHIVPIYEVGEHQGQPYFSMKFIEGGSLGQENVARRGAENAETSPLRSPRLCAQLLATVARAVHYAHQRGILHRDLKPGNILLDAQGQPYVTDFGLAKRVEGDSSLTQSGAIVGTPSYMAPEQAAGDKHLTTAADVYSLGAILYELLTGQPPFRAETPLDTLIQVRQQEAVRPRVLNPRVERDLETICLKCLEKEPQRRYGSAEALAEDLERWLKGEPIVARQSGAWERAVKWAKRRPAVAALAGGVLLLIVVSLAGLAWGWKQALLAGEEAENKVRAEGQARKLAEKVAEAEKQKALAESAKTEEAKRNARHIEALLALERASVRLERGEIGKGLLWLVRGLEVVPKEERSLQQSLRLLLAGWGRQMHRLRAVVPVKGEVVVSPNGKVLAAYENNTVRLLNAATGKELGPPLSLPAKVDVFVRNPVAFSADAKTLVTIVEDKKARIWIWDLDGEKSSGRAFKLDPAINRHIDVSKGWRVELSPDGKTLLVLGRVAFPTARGVHDYRAFLLDTATGRKIWSSTTDAVNPAGAGVTAWAFSPDGKTLLTAAGDWETDLNASEIRLWEAATGKPLGEPIKRKYAPRFAAFSPDGKTFVTDGGSAWSGGELATTVHRWETATRKPVSPALVHPNYVDQVVFSPDGKTILTYRDRACKLWSAVSGSPIGQLIHGPLSPLQRPVFSADGRYLMAGGRRWQTATGKPVDQPLGHGLGWPDAVLLPDGKSALTIGGGWIGFWDLSLDEPLREFPLEPRGVSKVVAGTIQHALSPDGKTLLTRGNPREGPGTTVRLWDTATGACRGKLVHPARVQGMSAFSPDSRMLVTVCGTPGEKETYKLLRWDVTTGKLIGEPVTLGEMVNAVAFTPDGKGIVTGGRELRRWDAATGQKQKGSHRINPFVVQDIHFSPDGRTVLTRNIAYKRWDARPQMRPWGEFEDDEAQLWDAARWKPLGEPLRHKPGVAEVAFALDGKTVLTISVGGIEGGNQWGEVRQWDAATGKLLRELTYPHRIFHLAYRPDGKAVLLGSDRGALLLDATTLKPLLPEPLSGEPYGFSPDGRIILTGGVAKLWDAATGKLLGPGFPHAEPVVFAAIAADRRTLVTVSKDKLRLWPMPAPVEGNVERLRLWVEVSAGLEMDDSGAVVELKTEAWQEHWQRLQKLGGSLQP
jgi:WD40 repeat protein